MAAHCAMRVRAEHPSLSMLAKLPKRAGFGAEFLAPPLQNGAAIGPSRSCQSPMLSSSTGRCAVIISRASSLSSPPTHDPHSLGNNSQVGISPESMSSNASLEAMIHTEIEAAVGVAVHEAMEAEMTAVQDTVAEAVDKAFDDRVTFDLRANLNTLVALTGVVIFERGIWTAWDVFFGDSFWSEFASIGIGLGIMLAIRFFNIPLAEWRRPS